LGYADAHPTYGKGCRSAVKREGSLGYADAHPTYGKGGSGVLGYAGANPTYIGNEGR